MLVSLITELRLMLSSAFDAKLKIIQSDSFLGGLTLAGNFDMTDLTL